MAKKSPLTMGLYIDGHDISGDVGAINQIASPRSVQEVPNLAASSMARILTLSDGSLGFLSYFDDGTELGHNALSGLPTTNVVALLALGSAIGDACAMVQGKQINYDPSRSQDGSLTIDTQILTSGVSIEWGEMLTALQDTFGSASSASSKDDAASSASGLAGVLEIVDIDSGTPTVVLEDSPNDSSWSTLISFSAVASGNEPSAERKTVSGTVNRYLRLTTTGTFSNLDMTFGYRRGETTDDEAYT
jgi:hypothetical protein